MDQTQGILERYFPAVNLTDYVNAENEQKKKKLLFEGAGAESGVKRHD